MVLLRLTLSYFRVRRMRTALTVAAIALSVSLVVSVTSGYATLENVALRFLNRYMGGADATITAYSTFQTEVPEILVKQLQADPDVRVAYGRLESQRFLTPPTSRPSGVSRMANGTPLDMVEVNLTGIRPEIDPAISTLDLTDGKWFNASSGDVALIDQVLQKKMNVSLGSEIELPGMHPIKLKIIGLVHRPAFFAERSGSIYMPLDTLQKFSDRVNPPQVTRLSIDLRTSANSTAFRDRWVARLASIDPNLHLRLRRDNAGDLEKGLRSLHVLSYLGGTISMLTAMFIIFTSLVMGVSERQRALALLRAIGATRGQVFKFVVTEGMILSIAGIILGIGLGLLWIELIRLKFPDLFERGGTYSSGGIVFAAVGSFLTALAASALPAWTASRLSPLEAMNPLSATSSNNRPPIGWALLGIILASLDPIMFQGPLEHILAALGVNQPDQAVRSVRFYGHFAIGLPGVVVGFFLLAPLVVWLIERALTPAVALLFVVPVKLLREQLTGGIWRAAGTVAALMVGLATLIAMQVEGHSLIGGWRLPDKFPDVFIWSPAPVSWSDIKTIAKTPGIAPDGLMPVVITTPAGDSTIALALAAATSGQNGSTMFFAVNPLQALHMVELEFRDNNGKPYPLDQQPVVAARVAQEMTKGRRILVTDEFRQARKIKIGDPFDIMTKLHGRQTYTVAGIVWSPGVDVVIGMFDLGRLLDQQTVGSVFGAIPDAINDFGATGATAFAADLQGDIPKEQLLREVQKNLQTKGLLVGDVRQIKSSIETVFYRLLALVSTVAIAALIVASLGVTNTVMASVRSRRWQFGVLRSIGFCRGELLRLVLAEAAMLGTIGAAMGLAAGLEISFDAHQLTRDVLGYSPDMVIPWHIVATGIVAVLAVAILASLWPAASAARAQPLELLQAGRAST